MFEHREGIIECMREMQSTLMENKIATSKALKNKRMLRAKFFIFHFVMPHVHILYNQLQKQKIDTIEVNNAVKLIE